MSVEFFLHKKDWRSDSLSTMITLKLGWKGNWSKHNNSTVRMFTNVCISYAWFVFKFTHVCIFCMTRHYSTNCVNTMRAQKKHKRPYERPMKNRDDDKQLKLSPNLNWQDWSPSILIATYKVLHHDSRNLISTKQDCSHVISAIDYPYIHTKQLFLKLIPPYQPKHKNARHPLCVLTHALKQVTKID